MSDFPRPKKRRFSPQLVILFAFAVVIYGVGSCSTEGETKDPNAITDLAEAAYVGSKSCQSCHAPEFADWKKSDHFKAMLPANDTTVLGDFNNASFTADGVNSRFYTQDGKYYINTQGKDGQNHDYQVLYTFGHFPLQQYLIAFPGGRMQATRLSWDSRENKWFNQYAGQKVHPEDWLNWTGNGQNWNTMCASCHSTNVQKNYDFETDRYHTTWSEINVGCESCHGPGSKHADMTALSSYDERNSGLWQLNNLTAQQQINTCAPCHARKSDISASTALQAELLDNYIPQTINDEFYHADGQIKEEDYVYGSFTQSKMFHKNVRCADCHNVHSGKLKLSGNALCMSCHEPKYNTKEHHFHQLETEGAQCINCHMTSKTYMGNDHRRDHSFRIPRPDQSVAFGTPNACNGCHKEKSTKWASEAVVKWYGPNRAYHFSDDLVPGSLQNEYSEGHLLKLLADTSQPEIARATAAFYLGNLATQTAANGLLAALKDEKAMVRYQALKALENFPAQVWQVAAARCLTDKVRAVRIAAADLFHLLPKNEVPASAKNAFLAADAENRAYLEYQRDFSVGNIMMADYFLQEQQYDNAILHYNRGLQKDSLINYARLNLATAHNSLGRNEEALRTLNYAAKIDPQNDRIFYSLGLLRYEMGDVPGALKSFQTGVDLKSRNVRLYYNYGLLLQETGEIKKAEQVFLMGYAFDQNGGPINYALATFYLNQNQPKKALKYVQKLREVDPDNPQYQPVFQAVLH
jgi:tetratricopeptide (TPR) repeat protein